MILQINHPMPAQLFYIDAMGRMPMVRCEASLLDNRNQAVTTPMQWSLQITDNIWPGACPSAKLGRQVMSLQGSSVGMGIWTPPFHTVCGGDATLTVSADYQGRVYRASVRFRIRGKNPSPDAVLERLGGEYSSLSHLARFLSALHQFDIQGMPQLGEHGEVGIMQLCDPAARSAERWSWTHNVAAGKALLQRAQGIAKAYLDQHRVEGNYPNNQSLGDNGVLQRETMQRFLGGAYWQWDERKAQWQDNPPDDALEILLQQK
jgi:hypothetical protein